MDRAFVFLFLYGATVLVGLFLTVFWAKVAARRMKAINDRWELHQDRYFVLSASIAVCAFGLTMINVGRLIGNLVYGLSPILQQWEGDWLIGPGLAIMGLGGLGMVWLADLEAKRVTWKWTKIMVGVSIAWGILAFVLSPEVPFYPTGLEPVESPQEAVRCTFPPATSSC